MKDEDEDEDINPLMYCNGGREGMQMEEELRSATPRS